MTNSTESRYRLNSIESTTPVELGDRINRAVSGPVMYPWLHTYTSLSRINTPSSLYITQVW